MLRRLLLSLPALVLVLSACGSGTEPAAEETTTTTTGDTVQTSEVMVVATTTILGDVVSNLVGDAAQVEVLMPVGADPHDYQPSARQVAMIQEADLVVANGLNLEEGLTDALEAAADDGANVVELAPMVDPLPFAEGSGHDHEDEHSDEEHSDEEHSDDEHSDEEHSDEEHSDEEHTDDEHGHDHGDEDPHFWLDPLRMAEAVRIVGSELAALDTGLSSEEWTERAEAYAAELEALDAELTEILEAVPEEQRKLVTNHEALGYFADRYDFEVVGVVVPGGSTLAEPSAEELAELVETLEAEGVSVVFAETTDPSALADAVAAELGSDAQVVELYTGSLGEPGSGADTYIGMMRTNAERIAEALS